MHHNLDVTTIATPRVTPTTKERTSFNIADPTYFSSGLHSYMYLFVGSLRVFLGHGGVHDSKSILQTASVMEEWMAR